MGVEYSGECKYCKDRGDSFIVKGSNEKDVRELVALHIEKEHKKDLNKDLRRRN
jgi:hypothetical protein